MPTIKSVLLSRSVLGGHSIELDFVLNDGTTHTLQIPYERIPHTIHAIKSAASVAETQQKVFSSGQSMFSVVVPYRATDVRTAHSSDGLVVVEFATPEGPMQVAMPSNLTEKTIQRLRAELEKLGKQQFPKTS
jgi:hypothetical protein